MTTRGRFNGIYGTYSSVQLLDAKKANRVTPSGVAFIASVAGKKTAGISLLKEAHHTSDDMRRAKKWLAMTSSVVAEIGTLKPEAESDLFAAE